MRTITIGIAVLLATTLATPAAAAGIGDKPLPLLNGIEKAKHVYSVPGLVDGTHVATSIHCASTEKTGGSSVRAGVEFFEDGTLQNDVTAGSGVDSVSAGAETQISTRNTAAFDDEFILIPSPVIGAGVARILATSPKIICAAFLVDPTNDPPEFMAALSVIKKLNQKGD